MNTRYLNLDTEELKQIGAYYTATEIAGQPSLWRKTFEKFKKELQEIKRFVKRVSSNEKLNIILAGAGTSAFIGDALAPIFAKHTKHFTKAVPTTDIVTHPEYYFNENSPVLMISFARSGDSPESVKAVELANKICDKIHHLIITCNPDGNLARMAESSANDFTFLLPPEANDKSLAMTGSFTSMTLVGLMFAFLDKFELVEKNMETLIKYGERILNAYTNDLQNVALIDFDRAVFLGSGFFGGVARESHLKLQELTDGKIICKFDSFLGFRHGPKAVMNERALISFIFSNDEYAQKYERDLVNSIVTGKSAAYKMGVSENEIKNVNLDLNIILNGNGEKIPQEFLLPVSVLPAQILGFYKSIDFGLSPDNPSVSGLISRVVEGVKLYEYAV
jgi:tagatose-6-phosphate ketose/aldose isomerase